MTAGRVGPLLICLSAAVLHCVSAGGAYCARTARARAAALGLDYPGDHGAPDLLGPPPHEMYPTAPHYFQNNPGPPVVELYNLPPNSPSPELAGSLHRSHTNTLSSLSGGESVSNPESHFEQVKRVGPRTQTHAPGQPDLVVWASEGHTQPLPFVYNQRDLVVDGSAPNRRGMYKSGRFLPQSWSHGIYHQGYPFQVKPEPVLYVFRPAVVKRVLFPRSAAWPLQRRFSIKHIVR